MDQTIVEIKKMNYKFGSTLALSDISLEIKKGDFLAIIGQNGSGKTTLLKLILGLYESEKSQISLFGENLTEFNSWNKIGYVPQKAIHFENNFPATVEEVVEMGLLSGKKNPKIITKEDRVKIANALKEVDMLKYKNRRIGNLSGGQQQRVLIAKALVSHPEILFLDEPTTGVDTETQCKFYELLKNLNSKGITIVLISHDIGRITKYVTKIASLNQRLEFYGSHEEFCAWDKKHSHAKSHTHNLCPNL
ncbi:MAG: ABC transporter ATP-binding protein [Candidatus Gracilibacteria bacterium]|nr:ABC transporter ATP-binding protein [Candidatus Gracilibacteria bacterium]